MRLAEALQIIGRNTESQERHVHLICGFQPLHLTTYLRAYLKLRFPDVAVSVLTGLYGDLQGNIDRAAEQPAEGAIVVIEWSDLDPRLGFRSSAGWSTRIADDILSQVKDKCDHLKASLAALSSVMPLAVLSPTLHLPPLTHFPPAQTSGFELRLKSILLGLLESLANVPGLRLASQSSLELTSPQIDRHDLAMDLAAGFPYTLSHADAVASLCVRCLFPQSRKKGIITDLDQTLWKGILGDVGVDGISWSLDQKSHAHALYQQLLGSLSESGVLVAIATKNDPSLVQSALSRPDLLVTSRQIFPVEASWNIKSAAVSRILKTWNVGADSVLFIDDNAMELAEVAEKFPEIECFPFPSDNPAAILDLIHQIRDRFGTQQIGEEDQLRLQSLRQAATAAAHPIVAGETDFVARLSARITLDGSDAGTRAFELVNKTNQFNLNGIRYTETEWKARLNRPNSFLVTVSYEDRFGPLGRIAVLGGILHGDRCVIDIWVMSCRAFSRHIEFQILKQLFEKCGVANVQLLFKPTERNAPLQAFLSSFFSKEKILREDLSLSFQEFSSACPALSHEVVNKWTL